MHVPTVLGGRALHLPKQRLLPTTSGLGVPCQRIANAIQQRQPSLQRPLLVALDGGSGAGKSTLAGMLVRELHATHIPLDDFFSAHISDSEWDAMPVPQRAQTVFDWPRVRQQALKPLLCGRPARWHPFDFEAGQRPDGTYRLRIDPETRDPAAVILLDGAYSAGPQLADLVDLSVLVDVPLPIRHARLAAREAPAFLAQWHARWDAVEAYYFTVLRPRTSFDLVVKPDREPFLGAPRP
jgi:para-aminobenzoate synthetase